MDEIIEYLEKKIKACDELGGMELEKFAFVVTLKKVRKIAQNLYMNISKEQFTKLAKEHLIALESYKMDKNGNKPIEIFGIEKLYEAIRLLTQNRND